MRIIVTGATGFIGRSLVPALAAQGHELVCPGREQFDVGDAGLHDFCGKVDAVIHLAGRAHKSSGKDDLFHAENVVLTGRVLRLATAAGARRFVFLSSIGVLGQVTHGRPLNEKAHCNAQTPYARSKLEAEADVIAYCSDNALDWTILRPPLVYGPGAPGNIGLLQRLIRRGLPLPFGAIRNRRSLIGVDNLVDLIAFCLSSRDARNQAYTPSDGIDRSTPELLQLLADADSLPLRLWNVPVGLLKLGAALTGQRRRLAPLWDDLQVNTGKLQAQLHWQPRK